MNEHEPSPEDNPYEAPVMAESAITPYQLGLGFWIPMAITFALCFALLYPLVLPGILGFIATGMALVRGLIWKSRNSNTIATASKVGSGIFLYVNSIILGMIATFISVICCVAVCVPLGIGLFSIPFYQSSNGNNSTQLLLPILSIACCALGLYVGFLFMRMTIPKVPPQQ